MGASVTERPLGTQAPAAQPHSGLLQRRGAALLLDLGDGGIAACAALGADLKGRLLPLARDADLYALVARGRSVMAPPPGRQADGVDVSAIDARVWELECFAKPMVTLLSGSPSSAALAMAMAGTHRVAGDAFACEIADVRRGAVPPGIIMHALSRLPDGVSAYLMLTGCIIGARDALGLGLITHCIADAQFDAVVAALADADPVDPVLDDRHVSSGDSALEPALDMIVKHFASGGVDAIVASLGSDTGAQRLWAATTAVQIADIPKAAALAAVEVLERAMTLDVRETTILVARANALLATSAAARFDAAAWAAHLATPVATDLVLASRAELQSLRRPAT